MKKWFKERFSEPTSWLAFAGLLQFVGVAAKIEEMPAVADAVAQNAGGLASGDYVGVSVNVMTALALALGFGKREKGNR